MSEQFDTSDFADRTRNPATIRCADCGAATVAMSILDTRKGKDYRLRRCVGCGNLRWREEV